MLVNDIVMSNFYRVVGNILSPSGERAKLSILIYHRVLPEVDPLFPLEVTGESFDKQLTVLKKHFNVLPLTEAIVALKEGMLPPRSACITFDDGYADNVSIALPILKRHGLQATFFIATAYLNGGRMFNDTIIHSIRHSRGPQIDLTKIGLGIHKIETLADKHQTIDALLKYAKYLRVGEREEIAENIAKLITDIQPPSDLMMNISQLKELSNSGMTIGGHTARHPILAKLNKSEASLEIAEGREFLESVLGTKINFFAYPNGKLGIDYLPEQVEIIKKMGFVAALSTQWGTANRKSDMLQLPRFTPYAKSIKHFTPMLFQNLLRKDFLLPFHSNNG
jgi:peptidoglycan/xylan/chitin deacetylase (PgdA/CDA1 family)